jgi:hypothetical protein
MAVPFPVLRIEEFDRNGMFAQGRQRQRRDELFGQRGHYDPHFGSFAHQQSDEYRSLVGCDTSRYPDEYFFPSEHRI